MKWKKKEFLPQKTESGQVEWASGMFFLLFLGILLCSLLQTAVFASSAQYLEDALAVSNLASAVVDLEEYGISRRVWIADAGEAYERYQDAVRQNLNLNEQGEAANRAFMTGPVRLVDYRIYNVSGNDVEVVRFDEEGNQTRWWEQLEYAKAPNERKIENTGVYSEIAYTVEGMFGISTEAHKGKLVDIAVEEK